MASQQHSEQLFFALSDSAVSGTEGPRTMKFQGSIQGLPILILIDSGSSHTFISSTVASKLSGHSQLPAPIGILVANGN